MFLEILIVIMTIGFIWMCLIDQNDTPHQRIDVPGQKMNQQMQIICNYRLGNCKHGNQGYQRVLLQLFGLPGNGKSSFINSCKFVIDGVYKEHAKARETDGGCTKKRNTYKLTDVITMVDNRGCSSFTMYEKGEIYAQLGNLVPLDQDVEWCKDYDKNVKRLVHGNGNVCDFIVPTYIHSVKNKITREELDELKDLLNTARELTGINPFIVLTNKSHGTVDTMCSIFKNMGFDKIYAIENYTEKDHQKVLEKHEAIQGFLCRVLENVNFNMEDTRNPDADGKKLLTFVIQYIQKADSEKKERELTERSQKEQLKRGQFD